MALYKLSLMHYQPVKEKEAAFWDWYEHVHIPYLFIHRAAQWKRVRMCKLELTVNAPEPLRPYADPVGQTTYLNILEQYTTPSPGMPKSPPPSEVSEGQTDFVTNWLPHLSHYSSTGYECILEKTATDYSQSEPDLSKSYRISLMRYDIAPEKEKTFHNWYDRIHIPELFDGRRGYRAVGHFTFSPARGGPPLLKPYQVTEGQPKYLILLERDIQQSTIHQAEGQVSHGVKDFVTNWLPHLRNYTSIGYKCLVDATGADFKGQVSTSQTKHKNH